MPTDISMPQLGESSAEGAVVKWLIPAGGRVEKDQSLLEVETDKVALEIPSPAAGYLTEVFVQEGETVPVGTLIARLEEVKPDGVVNKVAGVILRHMEPPEGGRDYYSPAVRQLAKEKSVDLAQVTGTGAGGRVTRKDVLDYLAKRETAQPTSTRSASAPSASEEILPFTPMRKIIAERMVKSRQTSAHVVTFFEADFSAIARFRGGKNLTYLPFVINAVTRAIHDVPILNSSWSESGILLKKDVHMGIAVALEDGLLVPVLRHADRKGLTQLAREVTDLAERARTKKLNPEEVQGGTFTITNHGAFGRPLRTPGNYHPPIALLGGRAVQTPAPADHHALATPPVH